MFKKEHFVSALIGAVILATAYLGFVFYKGIKQVNTNSANIAQIAGFLQQATQQQTASNPVQNN